MDTRQDNDIRSYLNEVPEDALHAVLRQMSKRPHSSKWKAFVNPQHILSVLQSDGPLSSAARCIFRELAAHRSKQAEHACEMVQYELSCDVDSDGYRVCQELINNLGPSLEKLFLTFPRSTRDSILRSIHVCTNLRSLTLYDRSAAFDLPGLLAVNSGNIRVLDITTNFVEENWVSSIAEHCVGLSELFLDLFDVKCSLTPVWKSVGPTLETVRLLHRNRWSYAKAAEHCTALTHISVADEPSFNILGPIGHRLKVLKFLHPMKGVISETSISKYKDLAIDASFSFNFAENLSRLGNRLRSLTIDNLRNSVHGNEHRLNLVDETADNVREAAKQCQAFETFVIVNGNFPSSNIISVFLPEQKPSLKRVFLQLQNCGLGGDDIAPNELAKVTSQVEELHISGGHMDNGTFRKFAMANQWLRIVTVHIWRWRLTPGQQSVETEEICAEEAAESLLEDLFLCPLMEEIVIDDKYLSSRSELLEKACHKFRRRNTDIFIGEIQYNL